MYFFYYKKKDSCDTACIGDVDGHDTIANGTVAYLMHNKRYSEFQKFIDGIVSENNDNDGMYIPESFEEAYVCFEQDIKEDVLEFLKDTLHKALGDIWLHCFKVENILKNIEEIKKIEERENSTYIYTLTQYSFSGSEAPKTQKFIASGNDKHLREILALSERGKSSDYFKYKKIESTERTVDVFWVGDGGPKRHLTHIDRVKYNGGFMEV